MNDRILVFKNKYKDFSNKMMLSNLIGVLDLYKQHLQINNDPESFMFENLNINDIRYLINFYTNNDNNNINLNDKYHNKQLTKILAIYSNVDFIYDINICKVIPNINTIGGYSENKMNEIIKQINLR